MSESEREPGGPRLYRELSEWWHLLSAPEDYAEEAEFFRRALTEACENSPRTLLELGCGGGNNASHLKKWFELTLVDLSPGMLAQSRKLNPECTHMEGDMVDLRLGRLFDAVFIHDAIMYLRTEARLRAAFETAWIHCRPGGAALFAPDHVKETFRPATSHGSGDGEGRALRYLEWDWDPDPTDHTYFADFGFLLREGESVRIERDRHLLGLFSRGTWLRLLRETGFEARSLPTQPSASEPRTCEVFLGRKPG